MRADSSESGDDGRVIAKVPVAVKLAEKVVRRVPSIDPTVVVDQVAEAIDYVARPCDVTVRIHPDDQPLVAEAMPMLVEQFANIEHVNLTTDETITRGGCTVSFGQGRIDATLDTQLDRIAEAMLPKPETEKDIDKS